jgi:divalent metal cation (Fe/Co/Zn/Cd) transporter
VNRQHLVQRALWLSYASIGWGISSGTVAFIAGLRSGSLGAVGVGLNVAGDVVGSVGMVWRFRLEKKSAHLGPQAERRVSIIVASALSTVALTLVIAATSELLAKSSPHSSLFTVIATAITAVVLAPLGLLKVQTGKALRSAALKGDGTLSLIGAGLGASALLGLLLNAQLHWWWADRCIALLIAVVASAEALRIFRHKPANS